jgi:nucleoside phosphorylase
MKTRTTIFICGVSHEFGSFRDAVEVEVQKKGCFADNQPGFEPDYRTVEEMLRRRLHDCDAVIHLVGFRFGAEPLPASAPRRSYTQMEFHIAREMGKPIYVFLSNEASLRDPPKTDELPEEAELVALQLAHRQVVQSTNHLYYVFRDKAELCRLVAEIPPVQAAERKIDVSRITQYAPAELVGRDAEMQLIDQAWLKVRRAEAPRSRVLTFVALGGEGKTSLVAKWVAGLASENWPGCDAAFAWSLYSQGTREQLAASSDLFLKEALTFFGDPAMAGSAQGAFDKGRRLAQLVGQRRALLILDGLEPLQYAPASPMPGQLKDQGISVLLKDLAADSRGLCLVTTRYSIPDLRAYVGKTVEEKKLTRLSMEAGVALLQSFGVKGSLRKNILGADGRTLLNEFEKLVEDVKGHALTLNLLGSYLRDAHAGDIRKRDLIRLSEADAEELAGHAFHVMDAYVESLANGGKTAEDRAKGRRALALLRLLGLFDRPATADCLAALWTGDAIPGLTEPLIDISEAQRNLVLQRLEDAKLLAVYRTKGSGTLLSLDAHPLLREYFGQRLRDTQPEAWRAAHRRLYEHLCATTKEGDEPTLEDLQPLYQAVAHGSQAGLQEEARANVYRDRIQRRKEFYSWKKLGAFGSDLGAVACFFETPWSRVSPALTETAQAWLLNEAANRLRGLGRLTEALEPMRATMEINAGKSEWENAAACASNLSELDLTLGEVAAAVKDAEQSVSYADRSSMAFMRIIGRSPLADALHQSGRRAEAQARFREAEQVQAERQFQYPFLYSLSGFRYCDLLLAEAEREAGKAQGEVRQEGLLSNCRAVSERAAKMFEWRVPSDSLLDIALDHLTLGRAALYAAILEWRSRREESAPPLPASQPGLASAATEIDHAVSGLRRASTVEFLPRGLLTRAWLRSLTGRATGPDSAQSDLDEAWEIAERGPMPLFQADIHLYRARLFFRANPYPWQSPQHDLAEARRLIFKHGYLRRKEELEDAESALLATPMTDLQMSNVTVFISYSHDSDDHRERVLGLSERLRSDGIETLLDQYLNGAPLEGWPRWMLNQLAKATHVLVVCTPTYYRRFRGHEGPGKGKGVDWEGALITSELYAARSQSLKFVPVFLSAPDEECIPESLRSTTYYALATEAAYQRLYDFLLQQAGVEPGPVGTLKTRPRDKGRPLAFDTPAPPRPNSNDPFEERKRRIDAAAPSRARIGDTIDVLVQVRMANSPRLGMDDFPTEQKPESVAQDSSQVFIPFPIEQYSGDIIPAKLRVRVVAPHFTIEGSAEASLEVPPARYSEKLVFLLATRRQGECRINVEILGLDGEHLRTLPLSTTVNRRGAERAYAIASLVVEVSENAQALVPRIQRLADPSIRATRVAPAKAGTVPMKRTATIVLVTVNDLETKAVLDAFVGPARAPAQTTVGGVTYNLLGNHGEMSIVHTIAEMGSGGVGATQQRTRQAIDHWKPAAVVAIGIAFGMDETKQRIGDVLVSTQIQDYELGRLGSDGTLTPRGDKPHASDTLCNRIRQTDTAQSRQFSDWPKVRFGLVLSGQKLVDNLDYRESLKRLYVEAIGGEMEATGLYVSAVTAKVDWIVVKAICDWGHEKNRPEKDAWQVLAAGNAVRVLKTAIELGNPFAIDEPSTAPARANNGPSSPTSARSGVPAPPSPALKTWKEKLEFLQAQEAIAFDPAAKFKMQKDIEEAKAKIRE